MVPIVGSKDRTTPLTLTDWMLEKSEKIPVPGALVVCRDYIRDMIIQGMIKTKRWPTQQAAVTKDEKMFDLLKVVNGLCLTVLHRIER